MPAVTLDEPNTVGSPDTQVICPNVILIGTNGIRQLLEETDTLVDGRFILAQRDLTLIYKGSRNKRIIDMNRTRAEGKLVLDPVEEENLRPEE